MPHFSKEMLENRALEARALAFNRQLPIGAAAGTALGGSGAPIPPAVEVRPDGSALLRFLAPEARSVAVRLWGQELALERGDNGLWTGVLPYTTPGFKAFELVVDGTAVMSPMAPIGFGSSKPTNYMEIPEEDCDFYLLRDVPHGAVAREFYRSRVTGQTESCLLYLPPDYMTGTERYPVLYLQHGHGENETCWVYQGKANFILDNLIAAGEAVPFVVVMNNGMVHTRDREGNPRMDSGLLESLLIEDCIPFIEGRYRVYTDKAHRAMAGLSMGSMQTSVITLDHPELFDYVGIFSGFLHNLMGGNDHLRALEAPDFKERYKVFMRCIGTSDVFLDSFTGDSELLTEHGLDPEHWPAHTVNLYPGGHEWQVWRKCLRDFARVVFR